MSNVLDKMDRASGLIVKYQVFWPNNNNARLMECDSEEECLKEIAKRKSVWTEILKRDITSELVIKRMVFKPEDLMPKNILKEVR